MLSCIDHGILLKFAVDERLHSQILMMLANRRAYPPPQTLVMATGICGVVVM